MPFLLAGPVLSAKLGPSTSAGQRRWPPLGLRARVTVAFGAGAAALSGVLAGTTYGLVHHYLLAERENAAVVRTYSDARLVKAGLAVPGANVAGVLSSLPLGQGTLSLLYRDGQWYSASVAVGELPRSSLPARGSPPRASPLLRWGCPYPRRRPTTSRCSPWPSWPAPSASWRWCSR